MKNHHHVTYTLITFFTSVKDLLGVCVGGWVVWVWVGGWMGVWMGARLKNISLTHAHTQRREQSTHIHRHTYTDTYTYTDTRTYTETRTCTHTHTYTETQHRTHTPHTPTHRYLFILSDRNRQQSRPTVSSYDDKRMDPSNVSYIWRKVL